MDKCVLNILLLILIIIVAVICVLLYKKARSHIHGGKAFDTNSDLDQIIPREYAYKRYPRFCCLQDPIPMLPNYNEPPTPANLKKIQTTLGLKDIKMDHNTLLLYWYLCSPKARIAVQFVRPIKPIKKPFYTQVLDVSRKQGMRIFYQLGVQNLPEERVLEKNYVEMLYDTMVPVSIKEHKIWVYFYEEEPPQQDFTIRTQNFYNTTLAAKLFLNKNSLDLCKYIDLHTLNAFDNLRSRVMFNTLMNFINRNISLRDQEDMLGVHGIVAYSLGLRNMTDVDIPTYNNPALHKKISELKFIDSKNFSDKDADDMDSIAIKIIAFSGVKNLKEAFYDPSNHMYFMGLKLSTIDYNMRSRFQRQRPKAIAEIMAFNYRNPEKEYPIPKIPFWQYKFADPDYGVQYTMEQNLKFKKDALNLTKKEIKEIKEPVDRIRFMNSILKHLNLTFRIPEYTPELLNRELRRLDALH